MSQGRNNMNHSASCNRSRKRRSRRKNNTPFLMGVGVVVVLAIIIAIVLHFKGGSGRSDIEDTTTEAVDHSRVQHNAVIDLNSIINSSSGIEDDNRINVKGMNAEEITEAVKAKYKWELALVNKEARVGDVVQPQVDINQTTEAATLGDPENPDAEGTGSTEETEPSDITVSDRIELKDMIAERIPALVDEIFEADNKSTVVSDAESSEEEETKSKKKNKDKESESDSETETLSDEVVYSFTLGDLDDEIAKAAKYASDMWYVEPLGGSIGSYDSTNDKFIMENSRDGFKPDRDKLASDIKSAIASKDYSSEIAVTGSSISAESSENISGQYKTLASFTTKTTSNAVRNKNIALACAKLNGTIVRPGEEFSFNKTVGQRTKEAGFGEAAAYNNGEVVQEVGGGVCQVSTTLYNAVLQAGLKITGRQSHTFKPSYVTPGMDATVSWGGPDFRFANLPNKPEYSYKSSYAIGIRASYSNQTVTVSVYGRPILKEGYTFSLSSTQTKTIEKVRKAITPDSGKTPTNGSEGSAWETRLVIKKDGELVSNNVDHNALYSGHIEYYYEQDPNESSVAETESSSGESTGESVSESPDGPGSGTNNSGVIGPSAPSGQNNETTAATQAPTTAAATTADQSNVSDAPGNGSGGGVISSDGPGSLGGHSDSDGPGD